LFVVFLFYLLLFLYLVRVKRGKVTKKLALGEIFEQKTN